MTKRTKTRAEAEKAVRGKAARAPLGRAAQVEPRPRQGAVEPRPPGDRRRLDAPHPA